MAKFHTWGEFNLEKKEVPMTHAEMPPRGHIPAYGVRNLAEGREVEIYPTALPHEPFNTVEYLSVQESQARESRAREEAFEEAAKEVDAWLDLIELDHRDIIAKGQYSNPQEASREYRNKCNLLGAVRASLLKKVKSTKGAAASRSGEGKL